MKDRNRFLGYPPLVVAVFVLATFLGIVVGIVSISPPKQSTTANIAPLSPQQMQDIANDTLQDIEEALGEELPPIVCTPGSDAPDILVAHCNEDRIFIDVEDIQAFVDDGTIGADQMDDLIEFTVAHEACHLLIDVDNPEVSTESDIDDCALQLLQEIGFTDEQLSDVVETFIDILETLGGRTDDEEAKADAEERAKRLREKLQALVNEPS